MNKRITVAIAFICLVLLSGCSEKVDNKNLKSELNGSTQHINFTYNNEPKFVVFNKTGNKILYGYIDQTGKEVIKPQFYYAEPFIDGVAKIKIFKDNQYYYGLIDSQGKIILEPEYDAISNFSEGLAAVKSAGKIGYVNKKGQFVIYPKYDLGYVFKEGVAKVIVENKVGFINKKGDYIIYPKYDKTDTIGFMNGYTIVKNSGKYTVINKNEKTIKTLDYNTITEFSSNKYKIIKNGKYGLINSSGEIVLEPAYNYLKMLDNEGKYIEFSINGSEYGVMDKSFREIIPAKYSNKIYCNDNLILVYDPTACKTLILDSKGKIIAKSDFKLVGGFSNDLCLIKTQDDISYGYINKKAEVVITPKFSEAEEFKNGLAYVCEKIANRTYVGYINVKGEYVWKKEYQLVAKESSSNQVEKTKQQTVANKTVSTANKYYSNSYNNSYYYDDYDYNDNYYYESHKSQDFVDAENDILN